MKKRLFGFLAACGLFAASFANAAPITYDITVTGGHWVTVGTPAFGLSGQSSLFGWVTVDSAFSGLAAFRNFSFTTGTHTWTLSDFVGSTADALFDVSGNLAQFSLASFSVGGTSMYFYSNNTTSIFDTNGYYFCNHCISVLPGIAREVPEPATLALMGLGIVWLGIRIGREKK